MYNEVEGQIVEEYQSGEADLSLSWLPDEYPTAARPELLSGQAWYCEKGYAYWPQELY